MSTKTNAFRKTLLASSLALTTLLAACGGGGGGGSSAPTSTTTTSSPTTTTASSGGTGTLATPQYAAGSQELAAFNQINAMRQQCGFPTVEENTLLDTAAANHLNYMSLNQYLGHYETQGNPGFTGQTELNRFTAVGYPVLNNEGTEVIYPDPTNNNGGALGVIGLASVPYHLSGMFYPLGEIGIGYQALNFGPSAPEYTLLMDFSNQPTSPAAPVYANAPVTFPCQSTTGIDYESAGQETPAPYVNGQPVNTLTNPIGTPITVVGNLGDTVLLTSGTMTTPGGSQITLNTTDSSNDPNHTLAPFAAFAFPTNPLSPNTTYSVTVNGTDNGVAFSRNFSFTTGNQGQF